MAVSPIESPDPIQLFTSKTRTYAQFLRLLRYQQGLRACFMRSALLRSGMLEYVPRDRFVAALTGLRGLLTDGGRFVLFITRDNGLMRPLIGRWWQSNLYTATQLREAFTSAGFSALAFRSFPPRYWHLTLWGHIVEASR